MQGAQIAFSVNLVRGEITFSYLQTYENAGIFEVWLTKNPSVSSDYGFSEGKTKGVLYCCDKDYNKTHPAGIYAARQPSTYSGFIDTFRPNISSSELHQETVRFGAHGIFLLHIRHVNLGYDECKSRKGNKVKIVAIHSC